MTDALGLLSATTAKFLEGSNESSWQIQECFGLQA
jgi:hypothetical protein